MGAPDGTLKYYLFPKFEKPSSYVHIYVDEIARLKDVTPENVLSIYKYKLNIISLKEKTLLPDSRLWLDVDNNLYLGHSLIYSNGANHIAVNLIHRMLHAYIEDHSELAGSHNAYVFKQARN
jgi:hypothetical protein